MDFLKSLNENQRLAVETIDNSLLILAGAGSGKTKTLTSRLAYLLSIGIHPANTLTLTFTNKAAAEMRERAMKMLSNIDIIQPPLLVTFHKFGLMFLRLYIHNLNRSSEFIIIDTNDKKKIIKQISPNLNPNIVAKAISKYKNSFISPQEAIASSDELDKEIAIIYEKYQNYLEVNNLVDFDDLLVLTYEILEKNEDLAKQISQKYQYIMVDEYQDTNEIQLKLLKKLCLTHNNICVVGDDDQSIYGFRGANVNNILNFQKEFNAKIIKLEQNYRSTNNILKAANTLISHNKNRHSKTLFSELGDGEEIKLLKFSNEREEAKEIANKIKNLINSGTQPNEIAILYRINALSRAIEEGLRSYNIPYKLIGGTKFYDREEIKDIIAYLRVIVNLNDDYSLKRIINKPTRGIGKTSLTKIENAKGNLSFYEFISNNDITKIVSKKAANSIKNFFEMIKTLQNALATDEFIYVFEENVKLKEYYKEEDKIANIDEFYALIEENLKDSTLSEFLNEISLQSDQDEITNNAINIMSIHASKGLEFEHVFLIGLEEGFFPIASSDIEEERRLAYVAITRAKKYLTLSYATSRYIRGNRNDLIASRFLGELGLLHLKPIQNNFTSSSTNSSSLKKGDIVKHGVFGKGIVIEVINSSHPMAKINFSGNIRMILTKFVEKI